MVKRLLKAALPAGAVVRLARARRSVDVALAGGVAAALRGLPMRTRALVTERVDNVGRVDYGPQTIRLKVDSETELARLNACRKEPETVAWIERFIRPGDVLFDIGANVGVYSFVAHRATGGACTVYAFEPSFSTFAKLSRNVALNGCEGRVIPVPVALADERGFLTFNYSSLAPGAALHALGEPVDDRGRVFVPALSQPVLAYRLDDFVAEFVKVPPNHIKLDVDGAELSVLRGAARTLRDQNLRSVLVEVTPARPAFAEVLALLTDSGFEVHSHVQHGDDADGVANYLLVRRGVGL